MARFDFDPDEYKDEVNNFQPVPRGEYRLKAVEAEEFDTKGGDGSYIRAVFEVVDGPYARRKIFQNFNINNPSDRAQSIGRGQIYAWRMACNKPTAMDSDQLVEVPFIGLVDIEPGKSGYGDQNRIRRFLDPTEVVKRTEPQGAFPKTAQPEGEKAESQSSEPKPHTGRPKRTGEKQPWDEEIPF